MSRRRSLVVVLWLLWSPLAWGQFVEPPLVDDCNRTQNPLAAATPGPGSWAGPYNSGATGAWSANGTTCGLATATGGSLYFGTLQAADQALAVTVPDAIGTTLSLQVRLQDPDPGGATFDAYVCRWAVSTNTVSLRKFINNGSSTQLGSALTLPLAHGDGVACQIVGTTLTMWHQPGGTGPWALLLSQTDTTAPLTGQGYVGLDLPANDVRVDAIRLGAVSAETVSQGAIMPLLQ